MIVNMYTPMGTVVVSVRLPEEIVLELKKRGKNLSEVIREIIIKEIKREKERLLEELKKLKAREGKSKVDVVQLIREDRDVLH